MNLKVNFHFAISLSVASFSTAPLLKKHWRLREIQLLTDLEKEQGIHTDNALPRTLAAQHTEPHHTHTHARP